MKQRAASQFVDEAFDHTVRFWGLMMRIPVVQLGTTSQGPGVLQVS